MNARDLTNATDEQLLEEIRDAFDAIDPVPPGVPSPAVLAAMSAQPIAYTVQRYKCPHCGGFPRSRRTLVVEHMARCWKNPAVKACPTCRHFDVHFPEIAVGAVGVEWCDAQDVELDATQTRCPLWALRGAS